MKNAELPVTAPVVRTPLRRTPTLTVVPDNKTLLFRRYCELFAEAIGEQAGKISHHNLGDAILAATNAASMRIAAEESDLDEDSFPVDQTVGLICSVQQALFEIEHLESLDADELELVARL
jgi:hypothetical protein